MRCRLLPFIYLLKWKNSETRARTTKIKKNECNTDKVEWTHGEWMDEVSERKRAKVSTRVKMWRAYKLACMFAFPSIYVNYYKNSLGGKWKPLPLYWSPFLVDTSFMWWSIQRNGNKNANARALAMAMASQMQTLIHSLTHQCTHKLWEAKKSTSKQRMWPAAAAATAACLLCAFVS